MTPPSAPARISEKTGWYFYDFANSAFYTTVITLFLGPYLTSLARAAAGPDGLVRPFGIPIEPRSWWGYLVAFSVMLQVVVLPAVGAMADRSGRKKALLGIFAYTGAFATGGMFFLQGSMYLAGGVLLLIANLAFGASQVVYNSFLPEIAAPEERDAVSSKGWALGYLGGGLLLALNLLLYGNAEAWGIGEALAVRISLASAGLWWAIFTILPMYALRNRLPAKSPEGSGFGQLFATIRSLRRYPQALTLLVAYLLYNDAIQTVIALASQFGNDELKIPLGTLTMVILMVQFVAFAGALLFNGIAKPLGAKNAILLSLGIWTAVIAAIYLSVRTTAQFVAMAAVIGLVLGGSQALSRSLFSQMIPKGKEAEYFSLYEISDKGTSWICPLIFGLALQFTQSYRLAILSLLVFFAAGMIVLTRVDVARGAREALSGE